MRRLCLFVLASALSVACGPVDRPVVQTCAVQPYGLFESEVPLHCELWQLWAGQITADIQAHGWATSGDIADLSSWTVRVRAGKDFDVLGRKRGGLTNPFANAIDISDPDGNGIALLYHETLHALHGFSPGDPVHLGWKTLGYYDAIEKFTGFKQGSSDLSY